MTNHPMLMQRDPPPVIDVTRPALPPLTPAERIMIVDALERIAKAITDSGCTRSHPHENMSAECERKTIAARAAFESAAQAAPEAGMITGPSQAVGPAAADQFKAGDRVMEVTENGVNPAIFHCFNDLNGECNEYKITRHGWKFPMTYFLTKNWYIRRPTPAELALHWPEVLP